MARTRRALFLLAVSALVASAGCGTPADSVERASAADQPAATAPRAPRRDLTIVAVGDVNLGRQIGRRLLAGGKSYPFALVKDEIAGADVAFANLESQISEQKGVTEGSSNYVFTAPPIAADAIADAGFDVVSTANNHAWDFGERAMRETLSTLSRVGVLSAGTGETIDEAYRPAIVERNGWRVGVVAVTGVFNSPFETSPARDHVAWADPTLVALQIKQLRATGVDVVAVSYHGGNEYQAEATEETRAFARACVDAGADLFIGHHPHVVQGMEWYAGKPIFYSLGNFIFKQFDPWTDLGLAVRLTVSDGGGISVEYLPVRADFQPKLLGPEEGARVLARVGDLSGGNLLARAPVSSGSQN
jgi:poly-gamma-glutamate synthesis protein (capsule biosynthesis protein)